MKETEKTRLQVSCIFQESCALWVGAGTLKYCAAATSTQLKEPAEQTHHFLNRLMVLVEGRQGDAETGGSKGVNL